MSTLFVRLKQLAASGRLRVSAHGLDEMEQRDLSFSALLDSLDKAAVVEEYPDYHKGPCVLLLHRLEPGDFAHALWGTSKASPDVATLITAYRPDPARWSDDLLRRLPK